MNNNGHLKIYVFFAKIAILGWANDFYIGWVSIGPVQTSRKNEAQAWKKKSDSTQLAWVCRKMLGLKRVITWPGLAQACRKKQGLGMTWPGKSEDQTRPSPSLMNENWPEPGLVQSCNIHTDKQKNLQNQQIDGKINRWLALAIEFFFFFNNLFMLNLYCA